MAKQLSQVKLIIVGDGNGPQTARFEYSVTHSDDTSLSKYAALTVNVPAFDLNTVQDFYDGYVLTIKENESII